MYLGAITTILLIGYAQSQDANCDFQQYVEVGQTYYVYSPNYPNYYTPGVQCRWRAKCPPGYNCRMDCTEINIPSSPSCTTDRLLISKTGDPQLTQAEYYCGRGTLSVVSINQDISTGLITSRSSDPGRFICELKAQIASTGTSCSCGYRRLNRIVGGEQAGRGEFPSMAGIFDKSVQSIKCGAVIIDNKYVLTAAHCVVGKAVNSFQVVVGEYDTSTETETPVQRYDVSSYLVHPNYTPSTYDYDIAIVSPKTAITYNDYVSPVCLPFKFINNDFAGSKVTITGWGTLVIGGPTSNVLRKVDLDVITQARCQANISTLTPRQMCTYTRSKDACQDDSGGPAYYTDPSTGLLFLAGIVSFGRSCASADPGVHTRVTSILDWVVNNAKANYCRK